MGRPRLVDYDQVRRLYATGRYTRRQLAGIFGVSTTPIDRAIYPGYAERMNRRQEQQHKVECANGCGKLVYGAYTKGRLCRGCWSNKIRTSVRETTLRCGVCHRWDFDEGFPRNKSETQRRGRHRVCRTCQAAVRKQTRDRRRVPCSNCGKPRLHPDDTGAAGRGLPNSGLCRSCFVESQRKVSA